MKDNKIRAPFISFFIIITIIVITTKIIGGDYETLKVGILLLILFYIIKLEYNTYDK